MGGQQGGDKIRVLIVEDNPHVYRLIRDGMSRTSDQEFEFVTVADGREAITSLEAGSFGLLIVDVYVPIMDGVHVIRQVRNDSRLSRLPILAISAGGASTREAALRAGADAFLPKPFRLTDLVTAVKQVLGRS